MQPEQSKLTRLPSLSELEKRADEEFSDEPRTIAPGIIEVICPLLRRAMSQYGQGLPEDRRPNARIHIMKGRVICENYSVDFDWRTKERYSKCELTSHGCSYSNLPGIEEQPK